jgi:heterodisulfide reductase subunit B
LFLMSQIIKDALARGANCFVTTCPMCQMNMDMYQDQVCEHYGIQEKLPVFFITELLGISMGFTHQELQIDRHFVDSLILLKELNLI